MLVYPSREFGMRPRKSPKDIIFRKQNYWAQGKEPTPWYVWDSKLPANRSKSEERPPLRTAQRLEDEPSSFSNDLRDYLMTSTLHGLRYIGERKLTWFERFFWLTAFGCSLVSAGFFILNIYAKWRSSPMIVSINPENMPLSNLPFPALTVCNVNQAKKTVAERYWAYGNPVDKKLLQSLCTTKDDSEIFEDGIAGRADWDHTRSFLINVTQPCSEMLAQCIWDSSVMNCEDLFNAQLTDEGLCCTFNVVHRNKMFRNPRSLNDLNITFPSPAVDWTPEDGYPADAPPDGFPWRPKGIGTHHGLSLVLDANLAEYYCASTKSAGFKILLHNPTETPKIRNLGGIYGPGREARIAIWPRISDAQPSLRSIDIKKRLCLFSNEKELVFFRTYTLKNCEMECEAQAMLDVCKCVYYYMPKNKSTRICGKADAKCYTNMSLIMPEGRDITCMECLPACTEIAYMEKLSDAPLKEMLVAQLAKTLGNRTPEYFTENMLVVHFYFEENTFMRFTKGEIFGLTEFLSNTGGLLGLCMGFSMMSAVELLYYLTLRALCMMRRRPHTQPFVK
ncbi:pickpocket protein 28-like isoform X1 [Spodoptera frugiperda]|uniref:Pickpocket protein 28-like isoform X1 n=1 Tax=Spodoptera frugiperda TaxID=7108 RepID=A0A9R0DD04_SPOFR|nr:pickpocket protein 28-like isoform X1 [Spodoptera frugiperda]